MVRLRQSMAFRLALLCGALVIASITTFAAIFYIGTIHTLEKQVNEKITVSTEVLLTDYGKGGIPAVQQGIHYYLTDGVDFDTETFLLVDASGKKIEGNLSLTKELMTAPRDRVVDRSVIRYDVLSEARVVLHKLPGGYLLVVGRDMKNIHRIMQRLWRTMGAGWAIGLVIAVLGTFLFRRLLEERLGGIRRTVEEVKAGKLGARIPVSGSEDEFARLSTEMNGAFDRIEQLMNGVRHVSNTIAHNLRTPLNRMRTYLADALHDGSDRDQLARAAEFSIEQIDQLIATFNKLLQIAESESGTKRQAFQTVALREVAATVVELYDAVAEEQGITLSTEIDGDPRTIGDRDLLASALANLLDNALKYGKRAVTLSIHPVPDRETVSITVQDHGPGIPAAERLNVVRPFYRLDRDTTGTGLGLSIVAAIARLHNATLQLEDAAPGLRVRIDLPLVASA